MDEDADGWVVREFFESLPSGPDHIPVPDIIPRLLDVDEPFEYVLRIDKGTFRVMGGRALKSRLFSAFVHPDLSLSAIVEHETEFPGGIPRLGDDSAEW